MIFVRPFDMLAEMLHISLDKRKAPTAGRLFLIIYSVSFLSLMEKRETLFVCVLINKYIFYSLVFSDRLFLKECAV